jgi:hypothetical protein
MPMNPRLLRPTASGFNPRQISGLALWLDGADASSLYTTDAGPVTAVSSPLDISGNSCLCWYDASDAASITKDGSNLVSQWNDKSGNARHATSSGSLRPTHGGSQNGRTVMQFTGTQGLTITGNFLQLENVTMFAVAMKNIDHFSGIISSAPTNPEDSPILAFYNTTIALVNRRFVIQQAAANGVYRLICGQAIGTTQRAHFEGVQATDGVASAALNTTNTVTKIGPLRTSDSSGLNGNIAEIVCYSGNLSTTDRARVEAYLAAKWGISGVHAPATATNDPVGAWLDKSGNARHVTQSVSGSRPTISATKQNGRNALAFNGSSQSLSIASYNAENGLSGLTRYIVASMSSPSSSIVARVWFGGGDGLFTTVSGEIRFAAGASAYSAVASTNYGLLTSGTNIIGSVYDGTAGSVAAGIKPYYNGAAIPSSSTGGTLPTTLPGGTPGFWIGSNIGVNSFWPGRIVEYISYSRALGNAERQRLERYLAAKWGITLAPQVSNADAQDWVNRVYANGGTVSASTASAVNSFCNAIDAAGIRDRFYRLNLFAGTGLNAALVPLYRGQSRTGTQYGNTTDTNVGPFVSGDYTETGASGGLLGDGTSKYLATGLAAAAVPAIATGHLSAYIPSLAAGGTRALLGAASGSQQFQVTHRLSGGGIVQVRAVWGGTANTDDNFAAGVTNVPGGLWTITRTSSTAITTYNNSTSKVTGTTSTTPASHSVQWYVFAANSGGTAALFASHRMMSYSIGESMTDTQVSAYYAAMQALQTSLGRNV